VESSGGPGTLLPHIHWPVVWYGVPTTGSDTVFRLVQFLGVAARVMARMKQVSAGEGPHRRPILLFPEGTTTNGQYLLGFRTGSFIAGVPVQPIILKYGRVRGKHCVTSQGTHKQMCCGPTESETVWGECVAQAGVHSATLARVCGLKSLLSSGCWQVWPGRSVWQLDTQHCPVQSRVSPAWETIGGAWHIFLMLANPLHTVTVYEVGCP
jgi:Acyltransferase